MAVVEREEESVTIVVAVRFCSDELDELRDSIQRKFANLRWKARSEAASLLAGYAEGEQVQFGSIRLDCTGLTPFGRAVTNACRCIPYGTTCSYGELAARAGSPGAARAVGSVMRRNAWPIVVPCHRVLASGGKIGGYSAPGGLDLKRRLLELEGADLD
jgi:methylated-DNA-[protein]-cysteine S-methyltransferase